MSLILFSESCGYKVFVKSENVIDDEYGYYCILGNSGRFFIKCNDSAASDLKILSNINNKTKWFPMNTYHNVEATYKTISRKILVYNMAYFNEGDGFQDTIFACYCRYKHYSKEVPFENLKHSNNFQYIKYENKVYPIEINYTYDNTITLLPATKKEKAMYYYLLQRY